MIDEHLWLIIVNGVSSDELRAHLADKLADYTRGQQVPVKMLIPPWSDVLIVPMTAQRLEPELEDTP